MDPEENQPSSQPPSKGYGKKPMGQKVLIYIVVAAVVYFLIYWFFIKK